MIGSVTGTRAVIAAAALSLALAGCSDDPEPKVADPAPTTPSAPTTEPSDPSGPTPPAMPDAAKGTDAAAAEAFVEFYWGLVNEAQTTGEVDALRMFADNCPTCEGGISSVESIYRDGGEIRGKGGAVSNFSTTFSEGEKVRAVVAFTLTNAKQKVDFPGVDRDVTYPGGSLQYQAIVEHGSDGWRVVFLGER